MLPWKCERWWCSRNVDSVMTSSGGLAALGRFLSPLLRPGPSVFTYLPFHLVGHGCILQNPLTPDLSLCRLAVTLALCMSSASGGLRALRQ